jgi:nucleotide-binding universal stress UspA family protein
MTEQLSYARAISDFREARRKAAIREIMGRITGKSTELLSYEEVRQKLRALESGKVELRQIPLDAIVGSVGRYTDFTRDFLPRHDSDEVRWAQVMAVTTGQMGTPPIEVYKIGEVYFVLDGNHRVSVARQLGATTIEAYVTEVRTKVELTPETRPDELIIKAEQTNFLEQTKLDRLRPNSDFTSTNPGQYPILLEHIEVHRYFMGIDEKRHITYQEAVVHWHDEVYCPIIQIIRDRGILRHFPGRTETDLYLWISKHRAELEEALEWHVDTKAAVADLQSRFSPEFSKTFSRVRSWIYDVVTPDALESGPAPGVWRQEAMQQQRADNLFANILVTISSLDEHWLALDQAIKIAQYESGQLQGLHIVGKESDIESEEVSQLISEFDRRCHAANVHGHLAVEVGSIARVVCQRSHWTDLIVSKLSHPPEDDLISRLSSGFRTMIRRCPRPIMAVPDHVTGLTKALLAYNGTPKADEGLYLATYLAAKWKSQLCILTIEHEDIEAATIQQKATQYLDEHRVQGDFILSEPGQRSEIILQTAENNQCDFIIIGGYKASPVVEAVLGSVVDEVLRKTQIPLLICR